MVFIFTRSARAFDKFLALTALANDNVLSLASYFYSPTRIAKGSTPFATTYGIVYPDRLRYLNLDHGRHLRKDGQRNLQPVDLVTKAADLFHAHV